MNQPNLYQYGTYKDMGKWIFYLEFRGKLYRNECRNLMDIFILLMDFNTSNLKEFTQLTPSKITNIWAKSTMKSIQDLNEPTSHIPMPQSVIDYLESL